MKLYSIILILFLTHSTLAADWIKDYLMPLAAGAYSDNPSQCWSNAQKYWYSNYSTPYSIYRQYTVRCNSFNDTCSGYIAVDDLNYTTIYIVFRGTNNNYQIAENGWNYTEMVPFVIGGTVSKVFFDGFNDVWNAGMKDDLLTLKNKYASKCQFSFIGHSLGGGMASLAASTFQAFDNNVNVNLYTFGQPRVGDKDFADAFNQKNISAIRYIHNTETVPHLPPLYESVYYHHTQEYWYNNDMSIVINCSPNSGEDPRCSDSLDESTYDMGEHVIYFGRNFMDFGKNGCNNIGT